MLNNLKPTCGSRKESKRRCRGIGSGIGKNGGTGNKGQKSRGTGKVALGFEGGQLPLYRAIPKFGFTNFTRKEYAIVSVADLDAKFENGLLTENARYTVEGEGTAVIPKGFAISNAKEEQTIADGLVITDKVDEQGNSIGKDSQA